MNSKHAFWLGATALLTLGISAIHAQGGETLKIGLANPLTGAFSPYGEGVGAQCMAEKINSAAGDDDLKVEIVMEDSRSDAQLTLSLAQKYLDAGVVVVHGTPWPDMLIPMAKMAEKYGAMVYSPQITAVEMHEIGLTNFIAGVVPDDVGASAAASAAYDKGARNAVLFTSDEGGSWTAKTPLWFGEALENLGGKVIGKLNYSVGTTDWSPQVTQLMQMNPAPDVVHICSVLPEVGILARQLSGAGYKGLVAGCDGFDDPSLEATVGSAEVLSRVIFATHTALVPGSPASEFIAECKTTGFKVNGIFDALGGSMIEVLYNAAKAAGTASDGMKIYQAIRNSDGFPVVTGDTLSFRERGTWPVRKVPVIGFVNGERRVIYNDMPTFTAHSK